MNCYTIEFINKDQQSFGNIHCILQFNKEIYCVVQILKRTKYDLFKELEKLYKKYINEFFWAVELDYFLLIKCEQIVGRCILTEHNSHLILTICNDLTEHD